MPWATAFYGDRNSLWIPDRFLQLMGLSDNAKLPGPVGGLLLTPISRNAPLFTGVLRGEYQEYQQLIFGRSDQPFFPFHEGLLVMGDPSGYIFFSDTRRWEKADKALDASAVAAPSGTPPAAAAPATPSATTSSAATPSGAPATPTATTTPAATP